MFALLLSVAPFLPTPPSALAPPALLQEDQSAAARPARVKKGRSAEVRPFYDRKTPLLLELPEGSLLEVVRQEVPWSQVRVPGGLEVWVHGDYVTWKDGKVHATTSRLRARPLPSTSGNSHPVGKLDTAWALPVLDQKDAWLKVLAPEDLSAWVLTEQLDIPDQEPSGWSASWAQAAKARRQAVMAAAVPVEAPEDAPEAGTEAPAGEPPAPQPGPEAQPDPSKPAKAEAREASAPEAAASAGPAPAKPQSAVLNSLVTLELLKKDPALAVATARKNLDRHVDEVTAEPPLYSAKVLDNCELVFTTVMLRQKDQVILADARRGLVRADALRKFHLAELESQRRAAEVAQGLPTGSLDDLKAQGPEAGEGAALWVGHLVHKPHQYPETPFVAVRSDREVLVHSFDGRFYLRDYLGRELVVRGTWRKTGKDGEQKVISIEEITVLPRPARLN